MIALDPKCVELPVRASQSKLWEIQRNYFGTLGIDAWDDKVPYYISSNMFIAERYANLLINAIQDWVEHNPALESEIFYFLELGCGTGKFSFYFLQAFEALLKINKLEWVKYCYILSDVAVKNIDYCKTNSSLEPYLKQNKIDFAHFDIVNDKDFTLTHRQVRFSELNPSTPLSVVANYTFDCVEADIFEHRDGQYHEVKLGLNSRFKNFNIAESRHLNDIRLNYTSVPTDVQHYYKDLILQDILNEYHVKFPSSDFYVVIPIGAVQFVRTLALLTSNNYFMIVGDKGLSQLQNISMTQRNHLSSYDNCFSFIVNFHAIAEYVKQLGGDGLLSTSGGTFKVNLYSGDMSFAELTRTKAFFEIFLEKLGPYEYCAFYKEYLSNAYRFTLSGLMSLIKLSEYDPDAYASIHARLIELIPSFDAFDLQDIDRVLQKVQENIYAIKMGDDIYNLIGIYYYLTKQDDKALPLFEKSIKIFQDKSFSYHNLGVLYDRRSDHPLALENFKKAYELDKNDALAKYRYFTLTGKMTYQWVMPCLKVVAVCALIAAAIFFTNK